MKKILITTGDYSADLHGAALVRELRKVMPNLRVTSLGGIKLKEVSDVFLRDMVRMDISGFFQPFKKFFAIKNILTDEVFPLLKKSELDAVILIDYYGFNIHVARKAHEAGIPVFYFVSPQVWASRIGRIERLKKFVTKMLVIFPFEEELYRSRGVPAEFVGHPMMDRVSSVKASNHFKEDVQSGNIRLGLMPGSRPTELARHMPLMIDCAARLKKKFPMMETSLFAVDFISDDYYRPFLEGTGIQLVRESDYQIRSGLTLCLTASGTATLENALLGLPMAVVYQTSWVTYQVAKRIIQVPFISMPNILAGKAVVPELIQKEASPESVSRRITGFFQEPASLERMHNELIQLREKLGEPGAYSRAARNILKALS